MWYQSSPQQLWLLLGFSILLMLRLSGRLQDSYPLSLRYLIHKEEFINGASNYRKQKTGKDQRFKPFTSRFELFRRCDEIRLFLRLCTSFIIQNQPIQFVICGVLQCIFDALIIIQIVYYRYNPTSQDVMASI